MRAIIRLAVLKSGVILAVATTTILLAAAEECKAADKKRSFISADAGYIAPFGLVGGVGWAPISIGEVYGQIGVLAFHTGTGMDKAPLSLAGFYTYALSLRARIPSFIGSKDRRHFTLGITWRGLPAGTAESDALDCLNCSDSFEEMDMKPNTYVSLGYRVKALYLQFDYRVSSHNGTGYSFGYDPYGVGPSWIEKYQNISAPKIHLYVAIFGQFAY